MCNYSFRSFGFTLIEIMLTIVIVSVLCSTALYSYQEYRIKILYNNSINIMEQNKLIVYSYLSKQKICPPDNTINQSLSGSSNKGNKILNKGCDIILCDGAEEVLYFTKSASTSANPLLTDIEMQYNCYTTDILTNKYLPQCKKIAPPAGTGRC